MPAPAEVVQVAVGVLTATPATPILPAGTIGGVDGQVRLLIARRPAANVYGGYWELPGGKLEPGESLAQCLVREFEEELGVRVRVVEPLTSLVHRYDHATVELHAYLCEHEAGELQARAVSEWRWVRPGELGEYRFLPANGPILAAIRGRLGG
ncbi:MAG: (deoxy)nucleoside triphosphate pyrophosphohydrolase [Phycisphaeraceae bacterium]